MLNPWKVLVLCVSLLRISSEVIQNQRINPSFHVPNEKYHLLGEKYGSPDEGYHVLNDKYGLPNEFYQVIFIREAESMAEEVVFFVEKVE